MIEDKRSLQSKLLSGQKYDQSLKTLECRTEFFEKVKISYSNNSAAPKSVGTCTTLHPELLH